MGGLCLREESAAHRLTAKVKTAGLNPVEMGARHHHMRATDSWQDRTGYAKLSQLLAFVGWVSLRNINASATARGGE